MITDGNRNKTIDVNALFSTQNTFVCWMIFMAVFLMPFCVCAQTPYRVTGQRLNVRNKPSTTALVVGTLNKGEVISVISVNDGWASFVYKGNTRYVSTSYLEAIPQPKAPEQSKTVQQVVPQHREESTITQTPVKQKNRKAFIDYVRGDSDSQLSFIADIYGGYSNFAWSEGSPVPGFGFGIDVGARCAYQMLWDKIPEGLFAELTLGYSRRGSGAFPINYLGLRALPLGYNYSISSSFRVLGKVGLYFAFPVSGIDTSKNHYDTCFDFGLSIGAGVEYGNLGLTLSYEHGFPEAVDNYRVLLYNRGVYFTLSYKFLTLK